jgi:transcriptional regulator GlxA family with amidase domain
MIIPSIFGDYSETLKKNETLIDWISHQYKCGAEVASMCSGAFLLAATGLLEGKPAQLIGMLLKDSGRCFLM